MSNPASIIENLGILFQNYRRAIKVTQKEIHEKTGVAMSTISQFENGKGQGLSLSHFFLLLDAVGLETETESIIPETHRSNLAELWKKQNKR